MKAIGYIRVSTDEQANSGLSLANQEARIRSYCEAMGWECSVVCSDPGESGGNMKRPGLQKALELIRTGEAQALVVLKLDRLTRSVKDLGELIAIFDGEERVLVGVHDSINTSTASGRLVLNILGSVAQWEREAIGERTAAGLRVKRERGEKTGGRVPYGFKSVCGALVQVPEEQGYLVAMRTMAAEGKSLRAIATWATENNVPTREGGPWQPKVISRLIAGAGK